MTSSMLTGEKRWASARRSGMTVLGKVAVPKPINLPSQRLENHGLDPNVEIVPKGTHSWGSRSSSSTSNPWGSSSLSPNTDGGTGSPSYLSGRPSSCGSGTRPSTAGSDRVNEPTISAWGSNSRPSSSSGALPSNQASHGALRPRSAETRPGSSHLSRFAEPSSDNSAAWGSMGTSDKLGITSSKNGSFSLTYGDFPTLGSEKDNSGKNADSQASEKEGTGDSAGDGFVRVDMKTGAESPWRRENSSYGEDGARANVEKWHADHQPYPNSNIPPQHYDSWRGPPVNNHPGGVWFRGPPGGPPFVSPVAPSGFPMEPFPYYRPQMPPPALASPQPVPPPGAGPRGPHPKNGDMYRPHIHDAYMRPSMPLRPGFYPGPLPYEGYYGPPMGYCNPNERDVPLMGMAMGPAAYNRYPGQNVPDPGNSHGRISGYGPSSKTVVMEQVESVHPQDFQGPYKVLVKQPGGWEGREEGQKCDDTTKTSPSYPLKGEHTRKSSSDNGWRADNKKDDDLDARRMALVEESSSEAVNNRGVVPMKVKSPEGDGKLNASGNSSVKIFDHADSSVSEATAPKDSSLIQKIEGLNAKNRASDGWQDVKPVSSREEQKNKLQVGNAMVQRSTGEAGIGSLSNEKSSGLINPVPCEDCFSAEGGGLESTIVSGTAGSRRSVYGIHGKVDYRGKGRFNTQESDGWRKKSPVADPQRIVSTVHYEISSAPGQDHNSTEPPQMLHPLRKNDAESMPTASEPSDSQRAKMRELAKRLKQQEKEGEEWTREQKKAKALAKLEELNRRTQAGDGVAQKLGNVPSSSLQNRQEESFHLGQPTVITSKSGAPNLSFGSNHKTVSQSRENLATLSSNVAHNRHVESAPSEQSIVVSSKSRASSSAVGSSLKMVAHSKSSMNTVEKSISGASNVPLETPDSEISESVAEHGLSKPFQPDNNNVDVAHCSGTPQVHDSNVSKQKRTGYIQKHSSPLERNSNEKLISSSGTEASKGNNDAVANATISHEIVADDFDSNCKTNLPSIVTEVQHRRKNRNGKNKHKVEEASAAAALPSLASKDTTTLDTLVESLKPKSSVSMLDPSGLHSPTDSIDAIQSSELLSSLTNEETHIRGNNQWRSQPSRRMMRNTQGIKSAERNHSGDAVIWAPVRSQHKTEVSEEANQSTLVESGVLSTKNEQHMQNNPRNRRAEMERYIPKPVAKELSQQGSSHQAVVASVNQMTSDETAERPDSGSLGVGSSQTSGTATVTVGPATESRNGGVWQNKSGKVHGAWRQQGVVESTTSNRSRSFQKSVDYHQHQKPDMSSMKEQPRYSDGWNMPEDPNTVTAIPVLKDQGMTARGKQQSNKGHKGTSYNHNPDEKRTSVNVGKVFIQSDAAEMHQIDSSSASKENHLAVERSTSHWQPKSQPISAACQRGSQTSSSVNGGIEGGVTGKKDCNLHGESLLPEPDKDAAAVRPESHHDQFPSGKNNLEEAPAVGHQEPRRERKMAAQRGRPGSPVESSSSNMEVGHDPRISSGFCKNGNQNSRFVRDHEARAEWSGSGKDSKQHSVPAVRERRRHTSHYEYHPVVPNNSNKANLEPSKDSSHNSSTRYRERGQSHSRRGGGNIYGWQIGSVQVDAGHD